MNATNQSQRGAVSIFIVIFTALLVTIVTTSFVQLMLGNQKQATDNDLSQSAYDSALAGVEDAKRALVKLKECQQKGGGSGCNSLKAALNSLKCESLDAAGVADFVNGEVPVQASSPDLNQAYTCVTVQVTTKWYEGELANADTGDSVVIPLDGVGDPDDLKQIRVSWFSRDDLDTGASPTFDNMPLDLPASSAWPATQPPVLRTQLIQFSKGTIDLGEFSKAGTKDAKTLFLYPALTPGGSDTANYNTDTRRDASGRNGPKPVTCQANLAVNKPGYLCSVTIDLPDIADREAYLQLAAYYNGTHYKVELLGDGGVIDFDGVQPIVDSTGRADDLFRRVKARVLVSNAGNPSTYPDAALSLGKNLCKDFFITDDKDDYTPASDCEPADN
jgi:Tfp pilus assembly protein PilX